MTEQPEQQPDVTITYDERNLALWISRDALAAARLTDGPNGPAAAFVIGVDEAHSLLGALQAAIDDRDSLRQRDNPDGWLDD